MELEEFKHPLATHLWRNHKAVPSVHCFTSAGYYIDHVRAGQLNNFPQSIEQFIKTTGPYDVVIDGLNVAYFKGFFDPIKVHLNIWVCDCLMHKLYMENSLEILQWEGWG